MKDKNEITFSEIKMNVKTSQMLKTTDPARNICSHGVRLAC